MAKTLIIGLGNPGDEYLTTRHNAGFLLLDELAKRRNLNFSVKTQHGCVSAQDEEVLLLKPQLFMNLSGEAVSEYLRFFKLPPRMFNTLIVAYDDLDLPLGSWKLVWNSGPKVHNGLNSIISTFGGGDFWHARLGTDARSKEQRIPGEQYVLQQISADEKTAYDQMNTEVCDAIMQKSNEVQ